MSTDPGSTDPRGIEADIKETREQVDQTLEALEERLSVKRKAHAAARSIADTAARASANLRPKATDLIRLDHTHVLAAFRRFRASMNPARKHALIRHVCLALEVHAQLEEEIFYPAIIDATGTSESLGKSVEEHKNMSALIQRLRAHSVLDTDCDEKFLELVRVVLHHIADEETIVLPLAERVLADELRELGGRMLKRRIELLKPHVGELATTSAQTFPVLSAVLVLGVVSGAWLVLRRLARTAIGSDASSTRASRTSAELRRSRSA